MDSHDLSPRMANTRAKILRAATALFAAKGFDRLSMKEIAEAADITMPTLYSHFGNKESLYRECCRSLFNEIEAETAADTSRAGGPEEVIWVFTVRLCWLLMGNNFARLLMRELVDNQRFGFDAYKEGGFRREFEHIRRNVECIVQEGAAAKTYLIYSMAFGILQLRYLTEAIDDSFDFLQTPDGIAAHILSELFPHLSWPPTK
jgi:AcrR family transcriptional regulator